LTVRGKLKAQADTLDHPSAQLVEGDKEKEGGTQTPTTNKLNWLRKTKERKLALNQPPTIHKY
jgi:hypothetical protein